MIYGLLSDRDQRSVLRYLPGPGLSEMSSPPWARKLRRSPAPVLPSIVVV
jgi:hypothetical protein